MSEILCTLLEKDELIQIPESIKAKLENELRIKNSLLDASQTDLERVKVDYEQKCYKLDKDMIEMSSRLDSESSNCSKMTARSEELENEVREMREKSSALEMCFAESQGEIAALKHTRDLWKDEKLSMQHLVEKRELEINELKSEWKVLSDKLLKATADKNSAELKLDEFQNSGVTIEYHNKRLERENELLKEQNEQLSDELSSKTLELSSVKLEKENELVSLRGRLEVKMEECRQMVATSENLRSSNDDLEKKINSQLEKVKTTEEERRSLEELYRNELQSQVKLTELYKASAEDEEAKSSELATAVQELQRVVTGCDETNKNLKCEVQQSEEKCDEMVKEIEGLKKELEKANDLLQTGKKGGVPNLTDEELAELSPAAAMVSKFMKSGMTLTEIYTKFIEVVDDLEVSKQENRRLNEALDTILKELNEKAPVLKQQREDYERALATITQLTSQMDAAAIEWQHSRAEADDAARKLGRVERDNKRLEMETKDLSTQVRYLLKGLEESRGGHVSMMTLEERSQSSDGDMNVTSSSEVISGQLVTFRNIEELQEQNQKLLRVIRELSEERERSENDNRDTEAKRLNENLELANEELEKLRGDRDRQIEFVEAIVRQRDMYRVLLAQESNSELPLSVFSSPTVMSTSASVKESGDSTPKKKPGKDEEEQTSKALQVLKTEYDEYKKEVQGNNKVVNEQTESLRSKMAELRADNSKLQSRVEFSAEKYDVLKQSFDTTRKEAEMHRERNSKLLMLVQKHEMSLNKVTSDLTCSQQDKAKLVARLENIRSELDIAKRTEDRLQAENSSLKRDQMGQSVLLTNLQKIQQTMERQEFEVRSDLRSRLEAQERELKALRRNNNTSIQQKQVALQMTEKQLLSAQQNLEKQTSTNETTLNELRSTKEELEVTKTENENNKAKLASLEQRLARLAVQKGGSISQLSTDEGTSENLESKCASLQDEMNNLKLKLEKSMRAVQQHKDVALTAEESLKQANVANKELSEGLEARLKMASEHQTKLEQCITKLEDENRQLNSKKTSLITEVDLRTADLNKQLASLKSELDLSLTREKESRQNEQEARKQYTEQMNLIQEAQGKYQREMLLHADTVKELMSLKETISKHDSELENALNDSQQAKHLLDSNKGMWEKQRDKLLEENTQMKERNEELSGQVTLLHSQIETMSNQMIMMQKRQRSCSPTPAARYRMRGAPTTSTDDMDDGQNKSNEQLMDIIKFMRKDKNLFEMKYEVAQSECNRIQQQYTSIQKQLDEAKKSLQEERHKSQASTSELSKHDALMKKVETLNVLSDSNRLLRDEKERLQEELNEIKSQLTEAKGQITPLKTENVQFSTQITTLKSEKAMLEQDVHRWQQRSQQLIQSPRRQDPEEYRRLNNEKQRLQRNVDQVNKEITERKLEVSNLQGEIRTLTQQAEQQKNENVSLLKRAETSENELKTKLSEMEEKNKTIMQIRRVGRRYRAQYEELQKKHQELVANQKPAEESSSQEAAATEAALAENAAKTAAIDAYLSKVMKEKEEVSKQLESSQAEVESLKSELQHLKERTQGESKVSSSEIVEENQKLIGEREEMKKQLQEKDEKSKRLLTVAKNRIEQIRKEKDDMASDKDRLRAAEEKSKEELERLKQEVKAESDQKKELQSKIEDLQRQLAAASTQQQQQNKVTSVVGHQHHHPGSSGTMELRKAANIRPISTQRVSQVSPMRVTRTARVMPEPHQEAQEGMSSESVAARSSPHAQVTPSSTHTASSIQVSTSSSQPTRAFVHPINPASSRHQHVVSSMPTSSASQQQVPSRSDSLPFENPGRNANSSTVDQSRESSVAVPATSSATPEVSDSDQAIVSSSDDQPIPHEDASQQATGDAAAPTSATATIIESEAAPSQSSASSSVDGPGIASSGTITGIQVHVSRQPHTSHKRSYDDAEEGNSGSEESPASSSDAQIPVAPLSKRQRSSPDQSSSAQPITSHAHTSQQAEESSTSGTRVERAESSILHSDEKSPTSVGEVGGSQVHEIQQAEMDDGVDTSTFLPISEAEANSSGIVQSSGAEDVIVLSSDDDDDDAGEENNLNMEQNQDDMYDEEEDGNGIMIETEDNEGVGDLQDMPEQSSLSSTRPILVLQPTPPDFLARSRPPIRPAPLTPGLAPPNADDGDGIVPCTPTLPTRRHDDNYQTINSPHVPPGGPPIRFRFEDSFQSLGGIGSVDNTIMDFSGAGEEVSRSVPNIPMPGSSITTTSVTHDIVEVPSSEVSAVSSSNVDQPEVGEGDKEEMEGEMCVPISSSIPEEETSRDAGESRESTSNLQNIRGRRIRLIGARPRGNRGGGNSPSASN